MIRREGCVSQEPALAIEYRDLDLDAASLDDACRGSLRGAGDLIPERYAFGLRMREGFRRGVRCQHALSQRGRRAHRLGGAGEPGEIDRTALGMEIEQALGKLRHLGDTARRW